MQRWQNPATAGCGGQWLVDRKGRIWKMDDTAVTFQVVSDFHGQVEQLDRIAQCVLALDCVDFPSGSRVRGHYENLLNWDVVKIFRYAWPSLDSATRGQVRTEISWMLDWCFANSCQPDGSFKVSALHDTPGDAFSYGVWLLRDSGFFRRKERFWTDQDFAQAKEAHDRIEVPLRQIGLKDPGLRDAYETLRAFK